MVTVGGHLACVLCFLALEPRVFVARNLAGRVCHCFRYCSAMYWFIFAKKKMPFDLHRLFFVSWEIQHIPLSPALQKKISQDVAKRVSAGGGKEAMMVEIDKGKLEASFIDDCFAGIICFNPTPPAAALPPPQNCACLFSAVLSFPKVDHVDS